MLLLRCKVMSNSLQAHGLVREPVDFHVSPWACKHISLPLGLPLPPPPCHPSRSSQSTELSSLLHSRLPLAVYFTHGGRYMSVPITHLIPPSLSTVFILPFSAVSIPALQIGSSVPFSRFHIYTLMWLPGGAQQ